MATAPSPPAVVAPCPVPPLPPTAITWMLVTPAGTVKFCSVVVDRKFRVSAVALAGAPARRQQMATSKSALRNIGPAYLGGCPSEGGGITTAGSPAPPPASFRASPPSAPPAAPRA